MGATLIQPAVTSFPWVPISWGADPLWSQNCQGRPATQKRQRNCDLRSFSSWQGFPGVREASERGKIYRCNPLSGFFCRVRSPHPQGFSLVTRSQTEGEYEGYCITMDGAAGSDRSLFSSPLPFLSPATHTANGEVLVSTGPDAGQTPSEWPPMF